MTGALSPRESAIAGGFIALYALAVLGLSAYVYVAPANPLPRTVAAAGRWVGGLACFAFGAGLGASFWE